MRFVFPVCMLFFVTAPALAAHVSFVGCTSDGQVGPQPIPHAKPTPNLPSSIAAKLSYYVGPYGAVLAPRGWHCFQAYGSNGASLFVSPKPIGGIDHLGFVGPAIQLSLSDGGTSGRFEVAEIAARLFPAAKSFVDQVEAEGLNNKPYVRSAYPADKIKYVGGYQALVTTPAGAEGIGTRTRLERGQLPIDSVVIYDPRDDVSLIQMSARLSPEQRPLVAYIIAQVKKER